MTGGKINSLLIPNVTKVSDKKPKDNTPHGFGDKDEFRKLLQEDVQKAGSKDVGVNISVHAAKRINERNMDFDGEEFFKIKSAIEKLKNKGGRDSLVVTSKGAYIVDVPNNKIVTAMDKENLEENVFTKIDSTLIIN